VSTSHHDRRIVSAHDFQRLARKRLPRVVYDYIEAGAGEEQTLRANRDAFAEITFNPQYLVDVSARDQSTMVFGRRIETPIMIAPAGAQRLACRSGEVATVRAAARAGTALSLSCGANRTIEEVAAAGRGAPLWFNLQNWQPRELQLSLIRRAASAGYQALLVSIDSPVEALIDRNHRNGYSIPFKLGTGAKLDAARRFRWLRQTLFSPPITFGNLQAFEKESKLRLTGASSLARQLKNLSATWADLEWFRSVWDGPLVVKGVLTPETARLAFDAGADGVVCSNHGGRMLDGVPGTMNVLSSIVEVGAERDKEVFLDGGIRRGTDVVKALALGARACLIGRPFFYALAVDGENGVVRLFDILKNEVENTLGHLGRPTLAHLDPGVLNVPAGFHLHRRQS
jgi:L-lactate dehydrogenase (cytochrome)